VVRSRISGWVFTSAEGMPAHHHDPPRRHFQTAAVAAGLGAIVKDEDGKRHYEASASTI